MAEHNELGKKGEDLAEELLRSKSFKILHRNWRFKNLEIDIIAQFNGYLIIAEVKTRETRVFGEPDSFVKKLQQKHLADAVEAYFEMNPDTNLPVRYDVISVLISGDISELKHFEDAFWPDNLNTYSADI